MLKFITKFNKIFRNETKNINLGRWNPKNNEYNTIYANYDNCGDELCGNVKELKKDIKKIKKLKFRKII